MDKFTITLSDIVEEKVPLEFMQVNLRGMDLWPLIRMRVGAIRQRRMFTFNKLVPIHVNDFKKLIILSFDFFKYILRSSQIEHLAIVNIVSRHDKKESQSYASKFDPIIEFLGYKSCFVFEYGTQEGKSFIPTIRHLEIIAKIVQKFISITHGSKIQNELDLIIETYSNIEDFPLIKNELRKYVLTTYYFSFLWTILLRFLKIKSAYVSNFANYYGQSLAFACRKSYIPMVDVQHGVQSESNFAYRTFGQHQYLHYNTLPFAFLCWRKHESDYLNDWLGNAGTALNVGLSTLIGNTQLSPFYEKIKKKHSLKILFSVSRQDDFPYLLDLINENKKAIWLVRLHPSFKYSAADWQLKLLESNPHMQGKIFIMEPSQLSLIEALLVTDLHITLYSSVSIEASVFGISTVFIEPHAEKMFPELFSSGLGFRLKDFDFKSIPQIKQTRFDDDKISVNFDELIRNRYRAIECK